MKYFAIAAIAGMLATASPALAADGHGFRHNRLPGATFEERCEAGKDRAADRLSKMSEHGDTHAANRDERMSKLEDLADEADAAGVDSSELRADIATLEADASAIESAHDAFVTALTNVSNADCSDEDGAKADVDALKSAGKDLRDAFQTARDFVRDTLREEIKSIREALGDNA